MGANRKELVNLPGQKARGYHELRFKVVGEFARKGFRWREVGEGSEAPKVLVEPTTLGPRLKKMRTDRSELARS